MKPNAYFVNCARGKIVDEAALAAALRDKVIKGAALDVFEDEPNVNPELLKLDNVTLTPHILPCILSSSARSSSKRGVGSSNLTFDK